MNILFVEATQDTPKIMLNKGEGIFELAGRSILEDPNSFYNPVIEWLTDYAQQPNPSTVFTFKLNYFNSSSTLNIFCFTPLDEPLKLFTIMEKQSSRPL